MKAYVSIHEGQVNIKMRPTVISMSVEAFFYRLVSRKHIVMRGEFSVFEVNNTVQYWDFVNTSEDMAGNIGYFASRNPDGFRQVILTMLSEITCDFQLMGADVSFMGNTSDVVAQPENIPA